MDATVAGAIVTGFFLVAGGLVTAFYTLRKTHMESRATPYEQLVERVGELEEIAKQVGALEERVNALEAAQAYDRSYIKLAVPWIDAHRDIARFPPPYPPHWWATEPTEQIEPPESSSGVS